MVTKLSILASHRQIKNPLQNKNYANNQLTLNTYE